MIKVFITKICTKVDSSLQQSLSLSLPSAKIVSQLHSLFSLSSQTTFHKTLKIVQTASQIPAVMALKQTLVVNNTLLLHRNPTPISSSPSRSQNPNTARKLAPAPRIRCSFDYSAAAAASGSSDSGLYEYERYATAGPQYPRPPEIQWKKELCNSVQLIGVVGAPIQIKHLASGKVVGWSRLAVKKSQTDTIW